MLVYSRKLNIKYSENGKPAKRKVYGDCSIHLPRSTYVYKNLDKTKIIRTQMFYCSLYMFLQLPCLLKSSTLLALLFIMELHRFQARRCAVQSIWSDSETNFVGANNKLQKAVKEMDHKKLKNLQGNGTD